MSEFVVLKGPATTFTWSNPAIVGEPLAVMAVSECGVPPLASVARVVHAHRALAAGMTLVVTGRGCIPGRGRTVPLAGIRFTVRSTGTGERFPKESKTKSRYGANVPRDHRRIRRSEGKRTRAAPPLPSATATMQSDSARPPPGWDSTRNGYGPRARRRRCARGGVHGVIAVRDRDRVGRTQRVDGDRHHVAVYARDDRVAGGFVGHDRDVARGGRGELLRSGSIPTESSDATCRRRRPSAAVYVIDHSPTVPAATLPGWSDRCAAATGPADAAVTHRSPTSAASAVRSGEAIAIHLGEVLFGERRPYRPAGGPEYPLQVRATPMPRTVHIRCCGGVRGEITRRQRQRAAGSDWLPC